MHKAILSYTLPFYSHTRNKTLILIGLPKPPICPYSQRGRFPWAFYRWHIGSATSLHPNPPNARIRQNCLDLGSPRRLPYIPCRIAPIFSSPLPSPFSSHLRLSHCRRDPRSLVDGRRFPNRRLEAEKKLSLLSPLIILAKPPYYYS